MVSGGRWDAAQRYEQSYWEAQADQIGSGAISQFDWYKWRADQLQQRLQRLGLSAPMRDDTRVVEVGSGPVGLATFYPAKRRVLIDPLADFYGSNAELSRLRSPQAEYLAGPGEKLPVPSDEFDLAIIENCIDHVRDSHAVMTELRRVLKRNGVLYLTVNCRSPYGYYVHRTLSMLRLDPGHPHTFTPERITQLVERHGFRVMDMETGSYEKERRADLASGSSRGRLKAMLGISEYVASVVACAT